MRFKILRLDEGSEVALAFAKRECTRLIAGGLDSFARQWTSGDFTITARAVEFLGEHLVKLWVSGGANGAILYGWAQPQFEGSAFGPCLFKLKHTASLPASQVVTAKALSPLAQGLSLTVKSFTGNTNFTALQPYSLKRATDTLERMVRNDSRLAQQLLRIFLQRTSIKRNGAALRTIVGDCLLSRWDGTDFWLMLGSFPRSGEAPQTVAGAALASQPYTGVTLRWSTLKGALTSPTLGGFALDLDALGLAGLVQDVSGYTRKDVYNDSLIPHPDRALSDDAALHSTNTHVPTTSPWAVVYLEQTNSIDYHPDENTQAYYVHTLGADGNLSIASMTSGFSVGTGTASGNLSGINQAPGLSCDLTFFDGEKLTRHGTHISSGAANLTDPLVFTDTLSLPPVVGYIDGNDAVAFQGAIPEYGLVLCTTADGVQAVPVSGAFTVVQNTTLGAETARSWSGITSLLDRVSDVAGSVTTEVHAALGLAPHRDPSGALHIPLYPLASGAPGLPPYDDAFNGVAGTSNPALGGVYWPRDGGMGVFIFTFPTDTAARNARAADVDKYQHIYYGDAGYRRAGADANPEAGYEDPEVVLARIAQATNVIANNFASPALFPWLAEGIVAVILDP